LEVDVWSFFYLNKGIGEYVMVKVTFQLWADQRETYLAQLADIERIYERTQFDSERLAEEFQTSSFADLAGVEVKVHLYTHILMLAQQWEYQVHTYLQ
jgi:hypothetical protein